MNMNIRCFFGFHKWKEDISIFSDYEKRCCSRCGERQIRSGTMDFWHEY